MNPSQKQTNIQTDNAHRIMKRLCKHWSHKLQIELNTENAHIQFENASCYLNASTSCLTAVINAEQDDILSKIQAVVSDHLHRMAYPEILTIDWQEK